MKCSGKDYSVDLHKCIIEVHVIGYRTKGESIVVLFKEELTKEEPRTFYCLVIDSYRKKYARKITNRTIDILIDNGVKRLPLLIMTHPHQDHIVDLDVLIEKYCDDNSKFCFPSHPIDIENGKVAIKDSERRIIRKVRKINTAKKPVLNQISVVKGEYTPIQNVNLYDNDDPDKKRPFRIEINALTPVGGVNETKVENDFFDLNDLSVTVIININGYSLLFGADTTNDHINHFDNETMSEVKFVKIPHHGSDTSDRLVGFFAPNQLDFACSTTYYTGASKLPLKNVLDLYYNASNRVDVIGCPSKDNRKGLFGEMIYKFKLGSAQIFTEIQTNGITRMI